LPAALECAGRAIAGSGAEDITLALAEAVPLAQAIAITVTEAISIAKAVTFTVAEAVAIAVIEA
jgi:hypothetical protein